MQINTGVVITHDKTIAKSQTASVHVCTIIHVHVATCRIEIHNTLSTYICTLQRVSYGSYMYIT